MAMRAFAVMAEPMPSSCAAICGGWSGTAIKPKRIASRLLMPSASNSVTSSVVSLSSEAIAYSNCSQSAESCLASSTVGGPAFASSDTRSICTAFERLVCQGMNRNLASLAAMTCAGDRQAAFCTAEVGGIFAIQRPAVDFRAFDDLDPQIVEPGVAAEHVEADRREHVSPRVAEFLIGVLFRIGHAHFVHDRPAARAAFVAVADFDLARNR